MLSSGGGTKDLVGKIYFGILSTTLVLKFNLINWIASNLFAKVKFNWHSRETALLTFYTPLHSS